MLKQRIITGLLLVLVTVLAVLYLPGVWLGLGLFIITAIAAWEWSYLSGLREIKRRIIYLLAFVLTGLLMAYLVFLQHQVWPLVLGMLWWIVAMILLILYTPGLRHGRTFRYTMRLAGFLTLIPSWLALLLIHEYRPELLLFLILLTASADTAAYFAGRRFGKTRLAPNISPGKTREGLWGALLAMIPVSLLGAWFFGVEMGLWFYFIALCMITALASVAGDLFESLLKRSARAKDSGTILPGHGGILDRIDSLTAAAPVFLIGLLWAGILVR